MGRADLRAQIATLQARVASLEDQVTELTAELEAALADLAIERDANTILSQQNEQLQADLAAATAEITRLRAIIDAGSTPAGPDLQSQVQQLD